MVNYSRKFKIDFAVRREFCFLILFMVLLHAGAPGVSFFLLLLEETGRQQKQNSRHDRNPQFEGIVCKLSSGAVTFVC